MYSTAAAQAAAPAAAAPPVADQVTPPVQEVHPADASGASSKNKALNDRQIYQWISELVSGTNRERALLELEIMSSTDKSHQFTHSNSERRASTVYGSVGKQGLFLPSDFIRSPKNSAIDADDNEPLAYAGSNAPVFAATETAPLLGSSAGTSNLKVRRKSSISRELIEQERELLKDNKIPIAHDEDDDETKKPAKYAAVYLQYITPGIPAYILFECGKRFLQAQGIYHISTYVLLFAAPSNLLMNIFFVNQFGYLGAPMAVAINYWLMAIGLYICTVYFVKAEDTPSQLHPLICWGGIDIKGAFKAWDKLIYLAIPGLIMLEAEFLAFEILTLMASYLGTIELAAQSIGSTMASLTYQVPFAIGIASSTRIANFLGAGLGEAAKKSTQVALSFGLLISVLNFSALYFFQTPIAKLFTNDEVVISTVKKIMWLIALMQISDAMNANSAGCLRGQGQTKIGVLSM
ncbi:hypothetical protein QCA50_009403 [Cerrena zonata]|uniref:Uncharacterized protein n=1 Tax=Cerrena zonata TaxID=2478898 RepID=A0AAW0G201_9APHY